MASLDLHVSVMASRATTFEYLIDFERYGEFAKSVREVRRDTDDGGIVYLTYSIAGARRQLTLRTEPVRDEWTLHWQSTEGAEHAGTAILEEVNPSRCALGIRIEHRSGIADKAGSALGVLRARLERDMNNFANHVEQETGLRPSPDEPDYRAPSEKLFDKVFPTDESTKPSPRR